MYVIDWIKPSQRGWTSARLVNEEEGATVDQITDNAQERVITVLCATHEDVAGLMEQLQSPEGGWINVQNGTAPVANGLNLFQGTITALRYLPTTDFDAGSYAANEGIGGSGGGRRGNR